MIPMYKGSGKRASILTCVLAALLALAFCIFSLTGKNALYASADGTSYIKWVDFGVTAAAMTDAMKLDVASYGTDSHVSWIDLLAYLGAKYGGNFKSYKKSDLLYAEEALKQNPACFEDMKYFSYYKEAYGAVLDGYLGTYAVYDNTNGRYEYTEKYGLKAFSPIARGYSYSDYDDFGASRSYGYRRRHLGHDMMGSVGTPIIAVESGYVEAVGWNQYGGWRIGIRSFDGTRYYYYAHLRKNHPYNDMYEGKIVTAGEVIGYLGMTGYSAKENVNNINTPHLHFGIQLIFNPVQKDGTNQIWIDCYEITKFLLQNRSAVYKNGEEYIAVNPITDFSLPD